MLKPDDHFETRPPGRSVDETSPFSPDHAGRRYSVVPSTHPPPAAADRPSLPVSRCHGGVTPSTPYFQIHEAHDGDWICLRLTGELDLATAPALRRRLAQLRDANRPVRLDLSGLEFIDSSGIHLLFAALDDASTHFWQLAIEPGLAPPVARLFKLTGLHRLIPSCSLRPLPT